MIGGMISNFFHKKKPKNYANPTFQTGTIPEDQISQLVENKKVKIYLQKFNSRQANYVVYKPSAIKKQDKQKSLQHEQNSIIRLKLLTYNVWFEQHNWNNRIQCLIRLIEDSDADFVCLQEVTKQFMECLHKQSNVLKKYKTVSNEFKNWYETIILSKFECRTIKKSFQNTAMGRSMLLAQVILDSGENIIVGSMHYESLDNQKIRLMQLRETFQACSECPNVIIAGDFNFSDGAPQNEVIKKNGYTDLWLEDLKIKGKKFSQNESYTQPKSLRFGAWRPDHIIYKTNYKNQEIAKCNQIKRVGNFVIPPFDSQALEMIQKDGVVRTPSDHLGLVAQIYLELYR